MKLVARHPIAPAELGDGLAQQLLGAFHAFPLVTACGETFEELLDQRRDRSTALGGYDPGMTIGGVVQ